jgi:hypothetical protein
MVIDPFFVGLQSDEFPSFENADKVESEGDV